MDIDDLSIEFALDEVVRTGDGDVSLLTPVRIKLPKLAGTLRGMTFTSGVLSANGPIAACGL